MNGSSRKAEPPTKATVMALLAAVICFVGSNVCAEPLEDSDLANFWSSKEEAFAALSKKMPERITWTGSYEDSAFGFGRFSAPGQMGFLGKPKTRWSVDLKANTHVETPISDTTELAGDSLSVLNDYQQAESLKYKAKVAELLSGKHLIHLQAGTKVVVLQAYGMRNKENGAGLCSIEQVKILDGPHANQTWFVQRANKVNPLWIDSLSQHQRNMVDMAQQTWFVTMVNNPASVEHMTRADLSSVPNLSPADVDLIFSVYSKFKSNPNASSGNSIASTPDHSNRRQPSSAPPIAPATVAVDLSWLGPYRLGMTLDELRKLPIPREAVPIVGWDEIEKLRLLDRNDVLAQVTPRLVEDKQTNGIIDVTYKPVSCVGMAKILELYFFPGATAYRLGRVHALLDTNQVDPYYGGLALHKRLVQELGPPDGIPDSAPDHPAEPKLYGDWQKGRYGVVQNVITVIYEDLDVIKQAKQFYSPEQRDALPARSGEVSDGSNEHVSAVTPAKAQPWTIKQQQYRWHVHAQTVLKFNGSEAYQYAESIAKRVSARVVDLPTAGVQRGSWPTAVVTVARDGSVISARLESGSGIKAVDTAFIQAIQGSQPYGELPAGAPESIDIRVWMNAWLDTVNVPAPSASSSTRTQSQDSFNNRTDDAMPSRGAAPLNAVGAVARGIAGIAVLPGLGAVPYSGAAREVLSSFGRVSAAKRTHVATSRTDVPPIDANQSSPAQPIVIAQPSPLVRNGLDVTASANDSVVAAPGSVENERMGRSDAERGINIHVRGPATRMPQFNFSPDTLEQAFNAQAAGRHLRLSMVPAHASGSAFRLEIGKGLQVSGGIDRQTGNINSLTVVNFGLWNNDVNKFAETVSCLLDVIDPSLNQGKAALLSELGLSGLPAINDQLNATTERNGFRYHVWTSKFRDTQNVWFSMSPPLRGAG